MTMSGMTGGDELALLVASFVEEVKPFFAGIRRGVAGIFAMPRDAHAITAARGSLNTIAASATMLELPPARQLAELAQLLDEAFRAAERGGVPDESHAPMLLMVDDLEAQLDGLPAADEREHGRARLDNSYHLLEQVLHTVEEAETAPAPALEIDLDDLLLTLQPAAPAPPVVPAPEPVAPAPEQADLVLLAEEEVAPIEWGEKEARLWEKGGWDESQAAYGNTGWIFLDEDETGPLPANVAAEDVVIEAASDVSGQPIAPEPAPEQDRLIALAPPSDELPPAAAAPTAGPAEDLPARAPLVAAEQAATATPAPRLDFDQLEEATLLALGRAERDIYLVLDRPAQAAYLADRLREMGEFAREIGLTVTPLDSAPIEEAAVQPPLSAAFAVGTPLDFVDAAAEPVAPEPLLESFGAASATGELVPEALTTASLEDRELASTTQSVTEEHTQVAAPALEEARPIPEASALVLAARSADLVIATAPMSTGEPASVAADELILQDQRAGEPDADGLDSEPDSAAAEEDGGFLASLLDDEPLTYEREQSEIAAPDRVVSVVDEDGAAANFAALPDVDPAIEAAFLQLNDADIATFLTLDGDAALAFLHSRSTGMDATPASDSPVTPLAMVEDSPLPPAADGAAAALEQDANLDLDPEILEVFLQEAQELLAEWAATSARLRRAPADRSTLADLRRVAHTLKGAANMMGYVALADCGRMVEELLDLHDEQQIAPALPVLDFVDHSYALVQALSADISVNPAEFAEDREALTSVYAALTAGVLSGALAAPAAPVETAPLPTQASNGVAPEDELEAADDELIEVFTQEAEDHLAGYNRALVALDRRPDDSAQLAEAKRVVHTLKGAAAALGYPVTGGLCHSLEDLFEALDARGSVPSRELLTLCFESGEVLEGLVTSIAAGRSEDAGPAEALRARYAAFLGGGQVAAPLGMAELAAESQAPASAPRSVRVDIAHLDNLLNLVGELVINRTSQEQYLERLGRTVSELLLSVDRLRRVGFHLESRYEVAELLRGEQQRGAVAPPRREDGVLRPFAPPEQGGRVADEFDDLEMDRYTELHQISRELVEIAADINAAGGELEGLHDNIEQTLTRQGRIATDLQDRMMEVRLVPIGTIASRLYRAVRGVAAKRGRAAELVVEGETTEIDKILLEELTDPLLHLVRNAADHGIESSAERAARGKPATGTIRLSAAREGNEAVIRVSDDGAGIDVDAVLEKAVARGMVRSREAINREAALDLIFLPGFSTSATVSDISGRGVGLDVVRTNVTRLKGTLDVVSTPGIGTTFTIRLPIMLAVTRALLVRSGAQTFAIPLPVVDQVAFYRRELVSRIGGSELFDLSGTAYPLVSLAKALGLAHGGENLTAARVLIVGNADRKIALVVDELIGQQEVVVKRLGRHLQSVAGVAGATILGNGQVVLILNVMDLLGTPGRRALRPANVAVLPHADQAPVAATGALTAAEVAPVPPDAVLPTSAGDNARLAIVVDDSLSVRRVLTRTLERDGWQVLGAKDGVEALEMLAWARPRVMLLDIEMPRMDGYELTNLLRNHPEHHDLPIAMLTSRAGEKHRRKAFDLGVSAYLVKPFEEAELLRTVRELAGRQRRQAADIG
jgi:chemosensory pili system protein ChpA (sensor histidine kinase/response regulator)